MKATILPVRSARGFTLLELIAVMGIMAVLLAVSGPAIHAIKGAGGVTKASADLARSLELARVYAMANRTYVRVGISQRDSINGRQIPSLVILTSFSADGSDQGDTSDAAKWPALGKPLVVDNMRIFDSLNAAQPNTQNDVTPSQDSSDNSGTLIGKFSRTVPGFGASLLNFDYAIQFSPNGEARVCTDEPARFIKIGLDEPDPADDQAPRNKNPLILRLSATNGGINILRKESM